MPDVVGPECNFKTRGRDPARTGDSGIIDQAVNRQIACEHFLRSMVDRVEVRQIERERVKLENNEKKMLEDIKKLAKKNQHGPAKAMSKDMIRMRN